MMAVTDGSAAIEFYKAAFGAQLLWKLGEGADIVAGLSVDGAPFFLAYHAPEYGTRGPSSVGFTTVRIELFVENPAETQGMAVEAGATAHSPIEEHDHPSWGPKAIRCMLQGAVVDPFGHSG